MLRYVFRKPIVELTDCSPNNLGCVANTNSRGNSKGGTDFKAGNHLIREGGGVHRGGGVHLLVCECCVQCKKVQGRICFEFSKNGPVIRVFFR